jgi:Copper type II ascorbate-dependent monooxygenase, C-terminal domain
MKTMEWIGLCSVAALFYVCGCSSSSQGSGAPFTAGGPPEDDGGGATATGSSGGNAGGSTGGSSSGGGTATGSSSGSGSGGSGSSSGSPAAQGDGGLTTTDGAPQDDPDIDYTVAPVTLTMTPFTVSANQEVYYCQNFANPWGGKQVDIKTYSLKMGTGSHHMFAFYQTNASNGTNAPCPNGGLTFGAFTFVSQSAQKTVNFPQSVGATIPASTGFQLMVHYLNTGASTITSSVALTMYIAKPNVVTQHAGSLFLNNMSLTVAPTCQTGCPSTDSYTLPQDVNILSTEGHMHKYGTEFVTTVSPAGTLPNGQLYETTTWDEPMQQEFAPPVKISSGSTITWTCTDVNSTGQYLTFGESAVTNVMCISQSIFYPVQDINNPVLGVGGGGL